MSDNRITVPQSKNLALMEKIAEWLHAKFGPNPEYSPSKQSDLEQWGLPWFKAAALVINNDGEFLLIHEGRVKAKKVKDEDYKTWLIEKSGKVDSGGWADGDGNWNIPAGCLRLGESFEDGVLREVWEETGHQVELLGIVHVRWGDGYVMPVYLAKDISGPSQYRTEHTREVIGINTFSLEGVRALGKAEVLRSPESVLGALESYEAILDQKRKLDHINSWLKS